MEVTLRPTSKLAAWPTTPQGIRVWAGTCRMYSRWKTFGTGSRACSRSKHRDLSQPEQCKNRTSCLGAAGLLLESACLPLHPRHLSPTSSTLARLRRDLPLGLSCLEERGERPLSSIRVCSSPSKHHFAGHSPQLRSDMLWGRFRTRSSARHGATAARAGLPRAELAPQNSRGKLPEPKRTRWAAQGQAVPGHTAGWLCSRG